MEAINLAFPEYFPEGCPPEDAKPNCIKVYRLVKNNDKLEEGDFLSYIEEGKTAVSKMYPFTEYGLSVNSNYDELMHVKNSCGALKKMKGVATGYTENCTGVIQFTPGYQKYHHTWWVYKNIKPHTFFKLKGDNDE